MLGIIPAAGLGSRIQPLAFSKELLPVGSRRDAGHERPRAVSEYLVDRMVLAGAERLCFVIAPGKHDILAYYGAARKSAHLSFTVQPEPRGLCDALFRALPLVSPSEHALIGLPDTVWFPEHGFRLLDDGPLSLLLFPVERPELFDAVHLDGAGRVEHVAVKEVRPGTQWVWGAIKARGATLERLYELWCRRGASDPYLGTLLNAFIAAGGEARGVKAGERYVDVGTLDGYREALGVLAEQHNRPGARHS